MRIQPAAGFDPATADDLLAVLGPAGVERLMASFATELCERPTLIAHLVGDGDSGAARFQAHYLKGAALSVGAAAIARACTAIEEGADRDLPQLASALATCARNTVGGRASA